MNWEDERVASLGDTSAIAQEILCALHVGVLLHDAEGRVVGANDAASEMLGIAERELLGTELDASRLTDTEGLPVDPALAPAKVSLLTGVELRRLPIGYMRGPQREQRWFEVGTRLLRRNGELAGVVCTVHDVTEDRRIAAELAQTRARYDSLLASAPGVLFQVLERLDGEYTIIASNASSQRDVLDVSGPVDPRGWRLGVPIEVVRARARAAARTGDLLDVDLPILLSDAPVDKRWYRTRARPSQTAAGTVWSGVALDVTHEVRLAEHVRYTQKREILGSLTGGLAHNVNNLLAVMSPALELVLPGLDGPVREVVERAQQSVFSAADLVRKLVRLTRTQSPSATASDGCQAALEAVELCQRSFPAAVRLTHACAEPVHVALGANDLQQILLILLMNARDAVVSQGGGAVHLQVSADAAFGRFVVSDDGPGVPGPLIDRLGEPFLSTKSPAEGSGLGLAAVYAIAQGAGGQVTYRHEDGARFEVAIPRSDLPPAAPTVDTPVPPPPASVSARILLAEDEPLVRHVLSLVLRRAGYEVQIAEDGHEAERMLQDSPFDLAILDISMPGPSGIDLLRRFRSPHLRIALLSGYVPDSALTEGADAIIWKPVNPEDLRASVRQLLANLRS